VINGGGWRIEEQTNQERRRRKKGIVINNRPASQPTHHFLLERLCYIVFHRDACLRMWDKTHDGTLPSADPVMDLRAGINHVLDPGHRNLVTLSHPMDGHVNKSFGVPFLLCSILLFSFHVIRLARHSRSSVPLATLCSIAAKMALSEKTGPWPSQRAHVLRRSLTLPTSTSPRLKESWAMMKSQAAPAARRRSPVSDVTMRCEGSLLLWFCSTFE
jgi:hypothetical protein